MTVTLSPVEKIRMLALAAADPDLSRAELAVMIVLADKANGKTGKAWPALTTLARETGTSQRHAVRAVKSLLNKKKIILAGHDKRSRANVYCFPEVPITDTGVTDTCDTLSLTPMSPDTDTGVTISLTPMSPESRKESVNESRKESRKQKPTSKAVCPHDEILKLFKENCPSLPHPKKITDARRRAIKKAFDEYGSDGLTEIFKMAGESDFMHGKNDRQWIARFDWILKPDSLTKILEGNFSPTKKKEAYHVQPILDGIEHPAEWQQ